MNYEQIFEQRGGAYDHAMRRWPDARRDDFRVPLQVLAPQPGEAIVDVPAGGAYLRHYLPAGCRWFGHEPCASFHLETPAVDLLPLPWADGFADAAISIAGVHHLEDKRPLFRELRRVVGDSGRFVLADVHEASAVAVFLDRFVGRYNSTGHQGVYLGPHTLEELTESGWEVETADRRPFCWWFRDGASLAQYCRMLFDVRGADDATIRDGVERLLGTQATEPGIGMNWELFVIRARAA